MQWSIKEPPPKLYWTPRFAWRPMVVKKSPAGPNIWVWLEAYGERHERSLGPYGTAIYKYRCSKEMMKEENASRSVG